MSGGDSIEVSLVDEEEDLLEYDDNADEGDDKEFTQEMGARKAAEMLLKKEKPCVTVSYETDVFLLFDCREQEELPNVASIICEKESDLCDSCSGLFASIRRFLEGFYGSLSFVSKELLLNIPCLDIVLCEDNVYNSQISFDDIATIFKILKERSERNMEQNIPRWLEIELTVRPRFVSRYNALVELTQTSATLGNIKPFTNDSSHPLVLDDTNGAVAETVTMDVDDEEEDSGQQDRPHSHDIASGNESDELLEIVDEEADEDDSNPS
ncbi:hypothetical protein HG537_0D00230 [Torulaspora globosa]|uniref:Uncharacterized protein n=1 Tax=Torulaspora globosa TaxID=48254 RepID=A0A7H9HRW0_9SACH|nr:hypothetical protein HG537_0D00230 [Torulaspora sp. CBS 2947]